MKKELRRGPKSKADFRQSPAFYEELAVLRAQEAIAGLMEATGTSKSDLASRLNQTKAHVSGLLSEDRNLTLRTLGKVCFHLGAEVHFQLEPLEIVQTPSSTYYSSVEPVVVAHAPADWTSISDLTAAGLLLPKEDQWQGANTDKFPEKPNKDEILAA